MKKLLLLSLIMLSVLAVSCSKDNSENEKEFNYSKTYEKVKNEIRDYLRTHKDATIENIQSFLDSYTSSVTYEVEDEVIPVGGINLVRT